MLTRLLLTGVITTIVVWQTLWITVEVVHPVMPAGYVYANWLDTPPPVSPQASSVRRDAIMRRWQQERQLAHEIRAKGWTYAGVAGLIVVVVSLLCPLQVRTVRRSVMPRGPAPVAATLGAMARQVAAKAVSGDQPVTMPELAR